MITAGSWQLAVGNCRRQRHNSGNDSIPASRCRCSLVVLVVVVEPTANSQLPIARFFKEPICRSGRLEGGGISANVRMTDSSDFEKTALPHLDSVFRTAFALCGKRDQADDLTQAAYLKAFSQFDSFRTGTNCRAWLLRILRNSWIDRLRHKKVVGIELQVDKLPLEAPEPPEESHWTNAEDILESFADEQIIKALKGLPDDQRLTVFLVDVEKTPLEEVAEILDVAVGTVKSRASRARAKLKVLLKAHAADLGFDGRVK